MFRWIDAHYNDAIVVIIALAAVFAGLVAFLQTWADGNYAVNIRRSQTLAVELLGQDMRSRQRESYDFSLYTTWREWDWRRIRAKEDEALAARADQITGMISALTPLLDPSEPYYDPEGGYSDLGAYYVDINLVTTTLLLEQRTFSIETANVWNVKSDGYITILTLLAVSLFLYGLSTTIKTNLRYLFAVVGSFLVGLSLVWTLLLTFSPVPGVPYEAIAEYARGQGLYYNGYDEEAREAFEAALLAYPSYGSAYEGRAEIHLGQGEYAAAAQDYRRAIELGGDDVGAYWNMGWAYYLAGDYESSLEASRRALEMDPDLFPVIMNVGTALLANGETEAAMREYERGLRIAADPNSPLPASWSHLYLLETTHDLERLINALDGQTDFYQVPDLSSIGDLAAVREAAAVAHRYIKEGIVAVEATGGLRLAPTNASLSPLVFARYVGPTGALLGQSETFTRGLLSIVAACSYDNLPPGAILSRRVRRMSWSGVPEYLPTMGVDITWSGGSSGTLQHEMKSPWPGNRGLLPGIYTIEYYVNGKLLQEGSFTIPEKETQIIGPIVFAPESSGGGVAYGPAGLFPAGIARVKGLFNYSGLPNNTKVLGEWYRSGQLYEVDSSFRSSWGSESYYITNVPEGEYRLDLYMEGDSQVLQTASFQVVDVDTYLRAVVKEPDEALFHRSLGDAYAYRDDYQQAAVRYGKAIELDPTCAQCYYRWWLALYDQGEYRQAIEKIQKAIELKPREYSYLCDLGKTYYELGDDESALAAYRQAVPSAPAYVYNVWGNALYNLERNQEAVVRYQQAIELNPDDRVYHANLGGAYSKLGEYDLAAAAYAQAVALDPSYASAYNKWGNLLYEQGKYAEAVEKYLKAVEADPTDAVYYANLAGSYDELGEYDLAAAAYAQAVMLDPNYASAYNKWGNVLYAQGKYAEAVEKYQSAIALDPNDAVYYANLGGAYRNLGEYELAAYAYEQAVALDPGYASAYNGWGNALYSLERYAEAAEKYQSAIALDPDDEVYYANLGGAYRKLGEYELAAYAYEQAVALDPSYTSAYNGWGNSLYALGRYAEAAEKYQAAVTLEPDVAVYHYNLGLAYYQQQENEKAIAEFEQAADLAARAGDEALRINAEDMLARLR